ncbi:MAG TPA: hypothetical protein VGM20_08590 [Gemmatimonadales bacterium]|jgi:hypothetical protein
MKIRFTLLADAANISQEGKLNILGEFNAIRATAYPMMWGGFVYVASMEVGAAEIGAQVDLDLRLVDADGGLLAPPLPVHLTISQVGNAPELEGEMENHPIIISISQLTIPQAGKYSFDLWREGSQVDTCGFYAVLVR